jgi:glycerol-3-phosphate acyltransferase PlsY
MLWAAIGYLLGSFPSGYIFGRLFSHRDIRTTGSGNVGGMNAFRNVGRVAGVFTGLFDAGKGALAVWLALTYGVAPFAAPVAGPAAVAGHNWMLPLGFKGGKGLGTTLGVLLVLNPVLAVIFLALIGLGALLIRDTNVGAGLAGLTLPLALWWAGAGDPAWIAAGAALALFIALKHLPDFQAYRAGRRRMI